MTKIDYTKCYYYDDGICFNEECMTKYCEDYDCLFKQLQQLKVANEELKNTIKEMEDDLDDWISDVSILYTYDDGKPNNLDELQCCMEHVHEEWSKYKHCLDEIFDLLTTCKNNLDKGNTCKKCKYINQCIVIDTDSWILQKIKEVKNNDN